MPETAFFPFLRFPTTSPWRRGRGYALAALGAAAALYLQHLLAPYIAPLPFLLCYPTVFVISRVTGFGPGVACTILCALGADYLFIEPYHRIGIAETRAWVPLGIFTGCGLFVSWLNEAYRRSLLRFAREAIAHRRSEAALKAALTRIEERTEALARSNAELGQFAYVASHDLKEPLRMVSNFVALLQRKYRGQLDGEAQEYIGFAVDGATRMFRLLDDLLAYSRVDRKPEAFRPVDLGGVVADVLKDLQLSIRESGAEIAVGLLPTVLADRAQLYQLFQNLLANALKFRGERSPRIAITVEPTEDARGPAWSFAVRDNGIGIDPRYADRIFVVFQRLHSREEYPGTGVGLAICKKIVERIGGRIWFEANPEGGSVFRFILPSGGEP